MCWTVALSTDNKLAVTATRTISVTKDKMLCVLAGFQTMAEAQTFKHRVQKNYKGAVLVRFVKAVCKLVRDEPCKCHYLYFEFCCVIELPPELDGVMWKLSQAFLSSR